MAEHSDRAHARARRLRKSVTPTERALWLLLRDKQLGGLRFRRQVPLGPFVVDFCCLSAKVIVEADGGVHRLREVEDAERDAWLASQGFVVLRFSNETILSTPNVVLDAVRRAVGRGGDTPHPARSATHLPPQGGKDMTAEVWFYHLERSTLDQVLPGLLEKTRERGWRALVRSSSAARLAEVDETLWTYRDDSFLAHGRDSAGHAAQQPILLTEGLENPNGAQALFILDGADLPDAEKFERCFILFDGRDEAAVSAERTRWRALNAGPLQLAYWRQDEDGRWEKAG